VCVGLALRTDYSADVIGRVEPGWAIGMKAFLSSMKYSRSTRPSAPIRTKGRQQVSYDVVVPTKPSADREHWNLRYRHRSWPQEPSPWLVHNASLLPEPGRALDVAGGTGRNALWLAHEGWEVTIADVSDVALAEASRRATEEQVKITTLHTDLATDRFPGGPWNLIALFHYLDRNLFPSIMHELAPGGVLIGSLATITNLERNARPPLAYLLEVDEFPELIHDLELVAYAEGWQNDHHDARFVARRLR
jgi:SAM-dependent methyltransferase